MDSKNSIEVKGLGKRVADAGGTLSILEGIDFTVEAGSAVAISGSFGWGKSTLLDAMASVILPNPQEFNQAARDDRGRKRERTVYSYARGHTDQRQDQNRRSATTNYLRPPGAPGFPSGAAITWETVEGRRVTSFRLAWVGPGRAHACSCMALSPDEGHRRAQAVFEGRVFEVQAQAADATAPERVRVRLRVVRAWKGVTTESIEVTTAIETTSSSGDQVDAEADPVGGTNLTDEEIIVRMREGCVINCGLKNKLSSVTYGGGDAGTGGGNVTNTFNYSNFNSLTVTHPRDPAGLS